MSTPFDPDQPEYTVPDPDGQFVPPPPDSPGGAAGEPTPAPPTQTPQNPYEAPQYPHGFPNHDQSVPPQQNPYVPQQNPYGSPQHSQGFPGQPAPGQPGQQWGQGYPQQPGAYGGYPAPAQPKPLTGQVQQATLFLYIAAGLIVGSQLLSFLTGFTMSHYGVFRMWTAIANLLQFAGVVMLFLSIWRGSLIVSALAKKADAAENTE